MSTQLFIVEGEGESPFGIDAFALAQRFQNGSLAGKRIRRSDTPNYLSEHQIRDIVTSTQVPPPLHAPAPLAPVDGNKDPLRFVAPIHASGWAVAAGYLGLFATLLVFAPFALFAGIKALLDLKANPHKTGKGRAVFGVVMGAVFSVLLLIVIISIVLS